MESFTDIALTLFWIKLFAATGILISTTELIMNGKHCTDEKLFSWKIFRSQPVLVKSRSADRILDRLLRYPHYMIVLWVRLLSILLVIIPLPVSWLTPLFLGVILLTTLLINFRSPFGQDGSDQMSSVLFITLFLTGVIPDKIVQEAGIWFIALQSCLSYFAAGVAKAKGKKWTSQGTAVYLIFNTASYGSKPVAAFLKKYPAAGKWLTWSVIGAEVAFPLVLIAGFPLCWLFIAWGVLFHLMNAMVMGLNSFLWAFLATYPAILFCTAMVSQCTGW